MSLLSAGLYVHRGLLNLQWKGDMNTAIQLLEKAIEVDEKCEFAFETLGTVEVQRGTRLTFAHHKLKVTLTHFRKPRSSHQPFREGFEARQIRDGIDSHFQLERRRSGSVECHQQDGTVAGFVDGQYARLQLNCSIHLLTYH